MKNFLFVLLLFEFFFLFSCSNDQEIEKINPEIEKTTDPETKELPATINVIIEDELVTQPEWLANAFDSFCARSGYFSACTYFYPEVYKTSFENHEFIRIKRFSGNDIFYDGNGKEIPYSNLLTDLQNKAEWSLIFQRDPSVFGPESSIVYFWGKEYSVKIWGDPTWSLIYYDANKRSSFTKWVSMQKDASVRNDMGENEQVEDDPVMGKKYHAEIKIHYMEPLISREESILYSVPLWFTEPNYVMDGSVPVMDGTVLCELESDEQLQIIKKEVEDYRLADYGQISDTVYKLACTKKQNSL